MLVVQEPKGERMSYRNSWDYNIFRYNVKYDIIKNFKNSLYIKALFDCAPTAHTTL